ncbi:hypothetical protein [Moorena producens]|uniref:hypothetical protein n=1 Tax=Moorena producens TaxID=1155739 RepID=UPI0011EA6F1E|nr:hypothetical protein [Moorena producens]
MQSASGGNPRRSAQITLILGWAVPTNALCKLHYLSGALPTLHEPSLLRMVQDVSLRANLE